MIEIKDPGEQITEEQVAGLEMELGAELPMQYRQFLLRFNGGLPSPDVVDIEGLPDGSTDVQVFFGIGRSVESSDLRWNKEWLSDRIPEEMLPVARDSGGGIFCLSFSGEGAGKMFFADIQFVGEFEQEVTFYPVADSFDSFIGKIREFSEP
jgi:SMI1-KNR4 cell-wall